MIQYDLSPLTYEQLKRWSCYDKAKGLKRLYPVDAVEFEQWVRLDFNGDGVADYSSPYQLREELATIQLDFNQQLNRYKLGRAIYHMAQRRGFKSSKGETVKEQEKESFHKGTEAPEETVIALKRSEEKKSKILTMYQTGKNLPTVGCAFASLEREGIRIRNSEYQAVRTDYKKEIEYIFSFQNGLNTEDDLFKQINSEKKGEGTLFYKRPLRSQKGLIGNCVFEPAKSRCSISHPEYETFRAYQFINNIRYKKDRDEDLYSLTPDQAERLYQDCFLRTKPQFKFEEIRRWIEKEICCPLSQKDKTINYKDQTNVAGCPISARFKNLLGNSWDTIQIATTEERKSRKGVVHQITYSLNDLWHMCFSLSEPEEVEEFAKTKLQFNLEQCKSLVRIWGVIPLGYANVSLKAIRKINPLLKEGLIYSDAVLLANVPSIIGEEQWRKHKALFMESLTQITQRNKETKRIYNIVNHLISNYKSLEIEERFAYKNTDYQLDSSDFQEVEKCVLEDIGKNRWNSMADLDKERILNQVASGYQSFFASGKRDYIRLPKLEDDVKQFLSDNFDFLRCNNNGRNKTQSLCQCEACRRMKKLYHPSQTEFYRAAKEEKIEIDGTECWVKQLGSPAIGAIRNPMIMRILYVLRKQINILLTKGIIDENTRIIIEMARDLNDANMRSAIEMYQRNREAENNEIKKRISEYYSDRTISDPDIAKARLFIEQSQTLSTAKSDSKEKAVIYKSDTTKYKLWMEQGCRCIYTGKMISITSLFDSNNVDMDHTIPRSLSFDDSLENLTICDAHYNRSIKKTLLPSQLAEYDEILLRIQPWVERVNRLQDNVESWRTRSRAAQDKETKDMAIRQKHLWQMELDYWKRKVERFTLTEVTTAFRNSQLNDTRILSRYTMHYLKSLFNQVDVQKGSVTAVFRKILGIQSVYEKKDRNKHSHHAIDAAILTIIPEAAKRERMIELFYQIEEGKKLNMDVTDLSTKLQKEVRECRLKGIDHIREYIEQNILIKHISKDQTLTPAKRRARKRGEKIFIRNQEGELVQKWITGDSIRGQLHKETYLGAITQAKIDSGGKFVRDEEGQIVAGEKIFYVVRRELKYKKKDEIGLSSWEDLEKFIVNKQLIPMMKRQFSEGTTLKEALEAGIYMLNKKGEKINKIRRVRCYTSATNPLKIKGQTYLSKLLHKQYYYAEVGDLYVMSKYELGNVKKYIVYNLFDVSLNRKLGIEDIPRHIEENEQLIPLVAVYKKGEMVLVGEKSKLAVMSHQELALSLYVIKGFEKDGNLITLKNHLTSLPEQELGKGESVKKNKPLPLKIRCSINTLKFIRLGIDFEILESGIIIHNIDE